MTPINTYFMVTWEVRTTIHRWEHQSIKAGNPMRSDIWKVLYLLCLIYTLWYIKKALKHKSAGQKCDPNTRRIVWTKKQQLSAKKNMPYHQQATTNQTTTKIQPNHDHCIDHDKFGCARSLEKKTAKNIIQITVIHVTNRSHVQSAPCASQSWNLRSHSVWAAHFS